MKARAFGWILAALLLPLEAGARETFPGQNDLAAGLACHRNLELDCARDRLERALATFSPERDRDYLEHVCTARWMLTLIHAACDDLARAERELKTLLLLDPDFRLPEGDHPPKIRYLYQQAREEIEAGRKARDLHRAQAPKPDPEPQPPLILPEPVREPFRLSVRARLVALFGDDAEVASAGPGAGLGFDWLAVGSLAIGLAFEYAYHSTADRATPLQAMSLWATARTEFALGHLGLRLGGGLGVLATGTADRYDHWGFCAAASVALVWPPTGPWGLALEFQPSLLVTADGTSFYLPLGLAGEVRW